MLGTPDSPGLVGGALLVVGLVAAAVCGAIVWRRRGGSRVDAVLLVCFALTLGAAPFLAWRVVEDLRLTTGLDDYTRSGAGPIQAYLQPYLLDRAARIVPPGATYATVTGDAVPYAAARKAFPALAFQALFPRVSIREPRRAELDRGVGDRPATACAGDARDRGAAGIRAVPGLRVAEVRR